MALAEAGVDLFLNARAAGPLGETAENIREAFAVSVIEAPGDITDPGARAGVPSPMAGQVDILITNAGGPPPGLWSDWTRKRLHPRDRCQHADAHRADAGLSAGMMARGWGAGGQQHFDLGQGADPGAGPVEHRARGPDRLCRRHQRGRWRRAG